MVYGWLNFSWIGYLVATLVMTHVTVIGVTLYLHRCQTHRSVALHPVLSHFFRLWLWMSTGMLTNEWVSVHRKHHAHVETPDDPHSPQIRGIKEVLFRGVELYGAAVTPELLAKYDYGTPRDRVESFYQKYRRLGVVLMLLLDLFLFGIPGLTIWAVQIMWIPFFAAGVVNGVGHFWGYRNFECEDAARNFSPWGILLGGEELHNNHHTYASSARFSMRWWEFDIGWCYLRLLQCLKLAKIKKLPPKIKQLQSKSVVDDATVQALLSARFRLLAQYSREVLLPIFKDMKRSAQKHEKRLFRRGKTLVIRDRALMSFGARKRLEDLLSAGETLRLAYQYREKFQQLWQQQYSSRQALLDGLQKWCLEAEAAGIEALQRFVKKLQQTVLENSAVHTTA